MLGDICIRLLFCHISPFSVFSCQGTMPLQMRREMFSCTSITVPLCAAAAASVLPAPPAGYGQPAAECSCSSLSSFARSMRIFHLAVFAGFGPGFQLFIFCQKVVYRDLVYFFSWPEKFSICGNHFFSRAEGFLFLLPGVDRGDTVQRGFNGLRLFGEVDRLLE